MSRIASNGIHHANLVLGTPEQAEVCLRALCDSLNIKLANNPDFFVFRTPTFGIDEARELSLLSARKALTGRKIFLIVPVRLTLEAQNALLKTFEDPFPDTYFFLAVREKALVIPTLRSRMETIYVPKSAVASPTDADKFLSLALKDRLLFAKKFTDEEKNVLAFLDDLLLLLKKQGKVSAALEGVYHIRRLTLDSPAAPRLVMEHLSLVL